MSDIQEKIKEMELQMAKARYNKATEKWFGLMKSQIAKLREKLEKKSGGKGGEGFFVKKTGNATVILVGFPSVGKSTLLSAITGKESKAAAYEFTTLDAIPGTLDYKGARIQVIDVPGIISGAASGRGRGKEVLAMARSADLVLFVIDGQHPEHYPALKKEIYEVGIRADEKKPDVKIVKKHKDGLSISSTVRLTKVGKDTLEAILKEFKMMNADVVIRDDVSMDQFIDAIEGNRHYVNSLVCITKADLLSDKQRQKLKQQFENPLFVSAQSGEGIEELKEALFDSLQFIRVYLKETNKEADMEEPMILQRPATIKTVCEQIHRDFVKKFRYAKVWGPSAKFPGQIFKKTDKELEDGDVVEITIS